MRKIKIKKIGSSVKRPLGEFSSRNNCQQVGGCTRPVSNWFVSVRWGPRTSGRTVVLTYLQTGQYIIRHRTYVYYY